jgi:hypothetical protein
MLQLQFLSRVAEHGVIVQHSGQTRRLKHGQLDIGYINNDTLTEHKKKGIGVGVFGIRFPEI